MTTHLQVTDQHSTHRNEVGKNEEHCVVPKFKKNLGVIFMEHTLAENPTRKILEIHLAK